MFCNDTMRLSRPKGDMNHGSPAAGMNSHFVVVADGEAQRGHVVDGLMEEPIVIPRSRS